eukprot:1136908-Pelagomonas_calceolata.AAC.12
MLATSERGQALEDARGHPGAQSEPGEGRGHPGAQGQPGSGGGEAPECGYHRSHKSVCKRQGLPGKASSPRGRFPYGPSWWYAWFCTAPGDRFLE